MTLPPGLQAIPFLEVFVEVPLAVAESRDVKGLYKKARAGELTNTTGIDSPYEPPLEPELRLRTDLTPLQECAAAVVAMLRAEGVIATSGTREAKL